jgi:surface protein
MSVIGGQNPIVQDGLVYILDFGNQRSYVSGSSIARSLIYNPVTASFTAPLPGLYSGLAAAYSIRKVVPNYTGPVMDIQSGSVSQSIGFDNFGNLDTASIARFAGSGNAFVKTWYDQSGNNRHATQTSTSSQPQIYSGSQGSVILENGKPAINFDGTNSILFTSTFTTITQPISVFHVRKYNITGTQVSLALSSATPYGDVLFSGGKFSTFYNSFLNSTIDSNTSQGILFSLGNGVNSAISINDETPVLGDAGTQGMNAVYIAGRSDGSFRANFRSQEIIIYQGSRLSDQVQIKNNINSYYNVYTGSDSGPVPGFTINQTQFSNLNTLSTNQSFPGFSYDQGNLTLVFTGQTKGTSTFATQGPLTVTTTTSSVGYGSEAGTIGRTFPFSNLGHITLRFSTGSVDCFVNGIPVGPNSIFPTVSAKQLPRFTVTNYTGSLGNLLVYNRKLTDDEIYAIYLQQARRYGLPEIPKPYTVDSSVYVYTLAAGITGSSTISALNTFVSGLKTAGLWDKMIAIYPFIGTSPSGSRLNLKDVSLNTTQVNYSGSWSTSLSGSYNNNTSSYGIMRNIKGDYFHPLISSESIHLSYLSYDTPVSGGYLMGVEELVDSSILPGDIATPAAAYSIRKVKSDYTGFCMDVRRDSDNTTGSIGFDVFGNLDTGSLLAFVTGSANTGSGFVARWYDQSGNDKHAIKTTNINQPQIVNSGSVILDNSQPCLQFDGINDNLLVTNLSSIVSVYSDFTIINVIRVKTLNSGFIFNITANASNNRVNQTATNLRYSHNTGTTQTGKSFPINTNSWYISFMTNQPQEMYVNNNQSSDISYINSFNSNIFSIGARSDNTIASNINLKEFIIYDTNQSFNRPNIEQNINSYFNLYTPNAYNFNNNSLSLYSNPTTVAGAANAIASGLTTGGPTGLITVSRTGSSNYTLWKNRVPTKVATSPSIPQSTELYLNAANLSNALFSGSQNNVSYASVGAGLTDNEVYTYYELVDTLQTNLGRSKSTNPNAFITTWDTRISGTGTVTGTSSIALPLFGTQAITASWGDGTVSLISQSLQNDRIHTYATPGVYTVSITGTGQGFQFNNGGDRNKLLDVGQWGSISGSTNFMFRGCSNLKGTAADALNVQTTSLNNFFQASSFSGYINNWDISKVTTLQEIFIDTSYNQPLNNWNTSNVTNMVNLVRNNTTFNQPLNNWNTSNVTSFNLTFTGASRFNQDIGSWNVGKATDFSQMFAGSGFNNSGSDSIKNWNISSGINFNNMFPSSPFNQPIGTWRFNTSSGITMANMFAFSGFNQNIGTWNVEKVTNMSTMFQGSGFNNSGSADINNWRPISCSTFALMFASSGFNQPIGNWSISASNINMSSMFNSATAFNQNIGSWDVSRVTGVNTDQGFYRMFYNTTAFNNSGSTSINNWRFTTSSTVIFVGMFGGANTTTSTKFNQNIGAWNVEKVTSMNSMFLYNTGFNNSGSSDINNWRPISCSNFGYMFGASTAFNQPIGNWPLSASSIDMSGMFSSATSFNQNIGAWDVEKVTNMSSMFNSNGGFNNSGSADINNWRPISCSDFSRMFAAATTFNQPIGNWPLSASAIDISRMFQNANNFDQDIGSWDVSNVTTMTYTFDGSDTFNNGGSPNINNWTPVSCSSFQGTFQNTPFNQPVEGWTLATDRAVDLSYMFRNASSFNQPLGNWNVVSCSSMTGMLDNCGMNINNYSNTLIGWASQPAALIPRNITLGATGRQYNTPGSASRAILTSSPYNWTITGDTFVP